MPRIGAPQPTAYYTHHNHRGDVIATRNGTTTTGTYDYTAFGSLKAQSGTDVCRFQFSSKERDASTGFSYYGYRFYAPQWQRWPNRDPLGESGFGVFGVYLFTDNDPVGKIDPDGQQPVDPKPTPPKAPPPTPLPPAPVPNPCPGFVSQWPEVARAGAQIAGPMGKATCCTHALQRCHEGCEMEYGAASTLNARESSACMAVCKADCNAKAAMCAGGKKSGAPTPAPPRPNPPKR
jgi:RHS repeat-associated protein